MPLQRRSIFWWLLSRLMCFNVLKLNVILSWIGEEPMVFLYRWAHRHGCKKLWQEAGPFSFSSSSSSWYTQLHPSPNMSALVASCHVAVYRMFGFLWLNFFQLSSFFGEEEASSLLWEFLNSRKGLNHKRMLFYFSFVQVHLGVTLGLGTWSKIPMRTVCTSKYHLFVCLLLFTIGT